MPRTHAREVRRDARVRAWLKKWLQRIGRPETFQQEHSLAASADLLRCWEYVRSL
jgi:hypothetical protein